MIRVFLLHRYHLGLAQVSLKCRLGKRVEMPPYKHHLRLTTKAEVYKKD